MLSDSAMSKRKAIPRLIRTAAAGALGLAAAGGLAAFAGPASAADLPGTAGAAPPTVFVQTDNPAGNQVIAFAQQPDGQLSQEQTVSTGGLGGAEAGANNLASQGSLTYDPGHHLLFAVNAGSDTISVLSVEGSRVRLDQVLSSGGEFPNSIAVHGNLVYVANAGGAGSVSGFWIVGQHVVPIPGSTRSLGLDNTNPPNFHDGPGQVIFSPNGSELLVTTKEATNSIDVFQVGPSGYLSTAPAVTPDDSNGPFAFAFTPSGQLVVAEVAIAALHTFAFGPHGTLTSLCGLRPRRAGGSMLGDRRRWLLLCGQRRQRRPERIHRGRRRDTLTGRGSCGQDRHRIHRPDRLGEREVHLRGSGRRRRHSLRVPRSTPTGPSARSAASPGWARISKESPWADPMGRRRQADRVRHPATNNTSPDRMGGARA